MWEDNQKYGKANLYLQTLAGCTDKGDQKYLQRLYIRRVQTTEPAGYNNMPGTAFLQQFMGDWSVQQALGN